jgi:hypothetical protein
MGWYISGVSFFVWWVTELRSTKLRHRLVKNGGDIEINDYVVFQETQEQTNRLPPPRTLILDFTMPHTRLYGQFFTLLDNLLTQDVQMVILSLMVLCRQRPVIKYDTSSNLPQSTRPNSVYVLRSRVLGQCTELTHLDLHSYHIGTVGERRLRAS